MAAPYPNNPTPTIVGPAKVVILRNGDDAFNPLTIVNNGATGVAAVTITGDFRCTNGFFTADVLHVTTDLGG